MNKEILHDLFMLVRENNLEAGIFKTARDSFQIEFEKKDGDYLEFEIYSKEDKISYLLVKKNYEQSGRLDLSKNVDEVNSLFKKYKEEKID
jgi:hypothetical protein